MMRYVRTPTRNFGTHMDGKPEQAVWDLLRVLQQPAAVASILTGKSGSRSGVDVFSDDLAAARSRDLPIWWCRRRNYKAAEGFVATRPLPLYYGMLALAKATILAWNATVSLLDLNITGSIRARAPATCAFT